MVTRGAAVIYFHSASLFLQSSCSLISHFLLFKNEGSSFLLNKKGLLENYFFFQFEKTLMAWHYIVSIFSVSS